MNQRGRISDAPGTKERYAVIIHAYVWGELLAVVERVMMKAGWQKKAGLEQQNHWKDTEAVMSHDGVRFEALTENGLGLKVGMKSDMAY